MRILFIVPYAPSLVRVRPYQLIRSLARRGHRVVVATLWTSREELLSLQSLAVDNISVRACRLPAWRRMWNCVRALARRVPLQSVYSWQPQLATEVARALQESWFDVVHVEHLRGALYGIRARQRSTVNDRRTPIVWDSVDCISHLFRQAQRQSRSLMGRWMSRLELSSTESYEGWLAGQFDCVLVTSRVDSRALQELARSCGVTAFPKLRVLCNGVDLDYFCTSDEPRDAATLVLTGKMSYHANITAARYLVEDIMPLIWERRPEVKVIIVGKNPPRQVRSLEHYAAKSNARGDARRVVVTGTVPDVRPYLRRATVAAVPLVYGAGVQNKVLEAMACGTAVVASSQATSALSAYQGRDLLVGGDPRGFARHVLDLLENPVLRDNVGRAGRRYVETYHSWDNIATSLESIYLEAIDCISKKRVSA